MGQKVNPNGFRVGVNKDWNATWAAPKKEVATYIKEDSDIRKFIMKNHGTLAGQNNCSISKITIERQAARVMVNIYTGRPGMLIGQKGAGIDNLKKQLQKIVGTKTLDLNIREIKNIDADAALVAQSIAVQLEKRVAWRRAMKMAMQKAMKCGIKGVKVMVGGRLDGADIARSEHYQTGILPLHTLRSDIEYGFAEAHTTFGVIGVKCWICHGEIKGKTRRTGEVTRASRTERTERPRPWSERRQSGFNRDGKPFERRPFDPNRPRPQGQGDGERRPYDPNRPRPPFDPNRPRPAAHGQGSYGGQSASPAGATRPRPAAPATPPTEGGKS